MSIFVEVLIGVIYVAIMFVLVRPGSPAANTIKLITDALTGMVGTVTGYTTVGGIPL